MVICPDCGNDVKEAKFCSNCGTKLPEIEEAETVKKTKYCTNCGTQMDADAKVCPECGFQVIEEKPQTKFCQSCGEKININAAICPHCGVNVSGTSSDGEKSAVLAAILSFIFPGLGHLYIGQNHKAITFIIAYIVSAFLAIILIGFILCLILWIWALIDVIKSCEALNRGEFVEDKLLG